MPSQRLRRHNHDPGSHQPTNTGPWHNIGDAGEPAFVNGSNAAPTIDIPNPVPLRFRLSVGPPNLIDDGDVLIYTKHQIEIQGDVTGLLSGDVVFVLPIEYRHDFDVPYHTHDDNKNYVPCRLFASGEFVWDVA